jgi:hypothetical protein
MVELPSENTSYLPVYGLQPCTGFLMGDPAPSRRRELRLAAWMRGAWLRGRCRVFSRASRICAGEGVTRPPDDGRVPREHPLGESVSYDSRLE